MSVLTPLKVWTQWWRTWGTLPVRSWIRAANLYRQGNYYEAEQLYRIGLEKHEKHPARVSALLDLSYCLFKQRKIAEAEKELRVVVASFPDHREAYIRLARIQLWVGRSADASFTLRRGAERFDADPEISALLLFALIDHRASRHLIGEATQLAKRAIEKVPGHKLLRVAQARCLFHTGERDRGRTLAQGLALEEPALFEAVVAYAEILLEEKKIDEGMLHLRRALHVSPAHPRVLSLMARAYLAESEHYNPDFCQQLATAACQSSAWSSPRDMQVLAEAYLRTGDRLAALITASKAKDMGNHPDGQAMPVGTLDKLLQTLMSESQI